MLEHRATLAALFAKFPEARDVEALGGSLEDAFLELMAADVYPSPRAGGPMSGATHIGYELLRFLRNRMTYGTTIALPLVLYYVAASANRQAHASGISFPLYFMTGMAAYGAMFAAMAPGTHLSRDRARGWTRQLRITPLRARTDYFPKVLAAYLVALSTLVLPFLAGTSLGVRLDAAQWLEMTGLLLVGLIPFILMGLILGRQRRRAPSRPALRLPRVCRRHRPLPSVARTGGAAGPF